jgi:hypothetical protein
MMQGRAFVFFRSAEGYFDHSLPTRILVGVKWLKTMITPTVLALWLPASSHALLESAGLIHQRHLRTLSRIVAFCYAADGEPA